MTLTSVAGGSGDGGAVRWQYGVDQYRFCASSHPPWGPLPDRVGPVSNRVGFRVRGTRRLHVGQALSHPQFVFIAEYGRGKIDGNHTTINQAPVTRLVVLEWTTAHTVSGIVVPVGETVCR